MDVIYWNQADQHGIVLQAAAWQPLAADVQLGVSYHLQSIMFFISTVGLGTHQSWLECPLKLICVCLWRKCV